MKYWNWIAGGNSSRGSLVTVMSGAIALVTLASGCGSTGVSSKTAADKSSPGWTGLPALVSKPAAPGLESGGGLAGGVWTVPGMPGAGGADDLGVGTEGSQVVSVGGTRVRLTGLVSDSNARGSKSERRRSGRNPAARFLVRDTTNLSDSDASVGVVFDSDRPADAQSCSVAAGVYACVIPGGVLATGSSYRVDTTIAAVTQSRVFAVRDVPGISGSYVTQLVGRQIDTGAGSFSLGIGFSSADQGVSTGSAGVAGFRTGLPVGWTWSGLPGNAAWVKVSPAAGFEGYNRLLTVGLGGTQLVLGCESPDRAGVTGCEALTGQVTGSGISGVIDADGSVTVTDSGSTSSWWFDRLGRLARFAAAGSLPVSVDYADGSSSLLGRVLAGDAGQPGTLKWEIFYNNDERCGSSTSAGFAAVPAGLVCGWVNPSGDWMRIFYTQPVAGGPARISRVVSGPRICQVSNPGACKWSLLAVTDYGWDESNRLVAARGKEQSLAVMAGALNTDTDYAKDPSVSTVSYDDLGRVESQTYPALLPGLARINVTQSYAEYEQVDSRWAPATRVVSTSMANAANPASPTSSTTSRNPLGSLPGEVSGVKAFDDFARPVWEQGADGLVKGYVWAGVGYLLAQVSQGQVSASVYDLSGRETGQFTGPATAFPASCSPQGASSFWLDACAPTDPSQVAATRMEFDQIDSSHVRAGWSRFVWSNPDLAGTATSITSVVDDSDAAANGSWDLPAGPAGAGGPTIGSSRFSGSLQLPKTEVSIRLTATDPELTGILWINGKAVCAIGEEACGFDNTPDTGTGTDTPLPARLDLARRSLSPTPDNNVVNLQLVDAQTGEAAPVIAGQRSGTPTQITTIDPLPAASKTADGSAGQPKRLAAKQFGLGAAGANVSVLDLSYGAVFDPRPDKIVKTGSSGQDPGTTYTSTVSMETSPGPNGLARTSTQSTEAGVYQTSYWGQGETPRDADLGNLGDLGTLADQPQYGKTRSVTDPTGRVTTFVYDEWGDLACHSYGNRTSIKPRFSCVVPNIEDSTMTTVSRGDDGSEEVEKVSAYELGPDPKAPITVTSTITRGPGEGSTDTATFTPDGTLLDYTDTPGTHTSYTYTPLGQVDTVKLTPKDGNTRTTQYGYDSVGRTTSITIDGQTATTIGYHPITAAPELAGQIDTIDYGAGAGKNFAGARLAYGYTGAQLTSRTWTFPRAGTGGNPATVTDTQTTTMAGRVLESQFHGTSSSFRYDGGMRLIQARIANTDFTYGYDAATHLTCTAVDQPNPPAPGGQPLPCDQLPTHHTTTWINDQPAATTIPGAEIPAENAYTSHGDLTAIGDMGLTYTATGQLATATATELSQSLTRTYDAHDRPATEIFTATGPPSRVPVPAATSQTAADADKREVEQLVAATETAPAETKMSFGYSAPGADTPAVFYSQPGSPVAPLTLPGGVSAIDDKAFITDFSQHWDLPVNADGSLGQASFTGPYGEYSDFGVDAGQASLFERITNSNTRVYSPQLGSFTAPDPSVYAGGPQYAYTPGDPVNYMDPNGTSSTYINSSNPQQVANIFIRIVIPAILAMAAFAVQNRMGKSQKFNGWAGKYSNGIRMAFLGVVGAGLAVGSNFCTASGCSSKNINKTAFWIEIGVAALFTTIGLADLSYKRLATGPGKTSTMNVQAAVEKQAVENTAALQPSQADNAEAMLSDQAGKEGKEAVLMEENHSQPSHTQNDAYLDKGKGCEQFTDYYNEWLAQQPDFIDVSERGPSISASDLQADMVNSSHGTAEMLGSDSGSWVYRKGDPTNLERWQKHEQKKLVTPEVWNKDYFQQYGKYPENPYEAKE